MANDNVEIQGLEFEIVSNTDKATKKVDGLTESLGRLKKALSGFNASPVTDTLHDIQEQADKVDDQKLSKLKETLSRVSAAAKKATSSFEGFGKSPVNVDIVSEGAISELSSVTGRVNEATRAFDRLKESMKGIKSISEKIPSGLKSLSTKIAEKFSNLGKTIGRAVKFSLLYNFVYSAINFVRDAFSEGFNNLYQYSKEFSGRFSQSLDSLATSALYLKNSLATAFAPLINSLAPALDAIIEKVVNLLNLFAQFTAALSGQKTYTRAVKSATEFAESTDSAAKSLKPLLLGFDELNILNDNSGGGSAAAIPDYSSMFAEAPVNEQVSDIAQKVKDSIAEIEYLLGTSMFALGAILTFSGANIPLGLGLMAAGAATMIAAVATNWDTMTNTMKSQLATLMEIVGTAFLAIGAILALTGNIPLGIALMVAGAASLVGGAAVHWNALEDPIGSALDNIGTIVSVAMLALGAVLAFSGTQIPLGIALMAGGALALGANAALNWNGLSDEVKNTIAIITTCVSLALLAVGAILAFTGHIPLGIALLAAGAVTMGTAIIPNWSSLSDEVKNTISVITLAVGAGLLALGAILAFSSPAHLPLGLGLMAIGALSLGTAAILNWDFVVNAVKKVVSVITGILGGALIVLGVLLCMSGVGVGLGLAVLAAGLGLSYAAWTLDDNPITNFVRKMANSVIGIINTVIDAINNLFHISFKGLKVFGEEVIPAFDVRLVNLRHIPTFADGGFVDQGQLFIAREAGAEMVGSIGKKTAVANNDQIVEGISSGVSEANLDLINAVMAMGNMIVKAVEDKDMNAYMDGRLVSRQLYAYNQQTAKEHGGSFVRRGTT